jgi:hypothetical protein
LEINLSNDTSTNTSTVEKNEKCDRCQRNNCISADFLRATIFCLIDERETTKLCVLCARHFSN